MIERVFENRIQLASASLLRAAAFDARDSGL